MTENLYSPSALDPNVPINPQTGAMFYIVSVKKFSVLYLATMGFYQLYWFYKNWSLFRSATKEDIWPAPRAIFSIFFVHSLLRHVYEKIVGAGKTIEVNPQSYATLLVVLLVISNGLERAAQKSIGSPYTDIASIAMVFPIFFQLRKAQIAINLACDDTDGASNKEFTTVNKMWITLGLIWWGLALLAILTESLPA